MDHHAHDRDDVTVAIVTVSSTRTAADDGAGDALEAAATAAGHTVAARTLVGDEVAAIEAAVLDAAAVADAVITTGGTGITADDVTIDVIARLLDVELPRDCEAEVLHLIACLEVLDDRPNSCTDGFDRGRAA